MGIESGIAINPDQDFGFGEQRSGIEADCLALIFELVNFKLMIKTFLGAVLFASVLGLFQFILQHSLGLKILGESVVSNSMVGVAKLQLFDFKLLRAYGTFAHPNIFSGFSGSIFFLS